MTSLNLDRSNVLGWICGVSLFVATVGCDGVALLPVKGRVVFSDGEPVRTGRIEYNASGSPHRAMGVIDDTGYFELMTADGEKGLPAGEYDVIVVQLVITEDLSLADHDHGRAVPIKYADYTTSDLKALVSDGNAEEQQIIVESK